MLYVMSSNREQGIGSNFEVKDPKDGFRKDNTVWFGTCSICNEIVSNSRHNLTWMHSIDLKVTYHASGHIASRQSIQIDYCPYGDVVIDLQ